MLFNSTSMTGVGVLTYIIALALRYFGFDSIENEQIAQFVVNCGAVVGFVLMLWGQFRRKDLKLGLFRK